jgi:MerR family transcriptional regulator, copper efflux regulator
LRAKGRLVNIRDYLKIKDAAQFLGVSVNTLRNWERASKIATYRHPVNGYRLYKRSDLESLLDAIQRSDLPSVDETDETKQDG